MEVLFLPEDKVYVLKESAIADPATVGLASFSIALFCLSCLNAGLTGPEALGVIIPLSCMRRANAHNSGVMGFCEKRVVYSNSIRHFRGFLDYFIAHAIRYGNEVV